MCHGRVIVLGYGIHRGETILVPEIYGQTLVVGPGFQKGGGMLI